jgi:hypothetical protein
MPLPHFTNLITNDPPGGNPGSQPEEVLYMNLFEITFTLPILLQNQQRDAVMLLQQAKKISMDLTPDISTAEQKFKFSTRAYMKMPEKTHVTFDIDFNLNVSRESEMTVYNTLRAWYDLVWNSQIGSTSYKSDLIGTIMVNHHDKKGVVLRRVIFYGVQITGLNAFELSWDSTEIHSVTGKFVADYWEDTYYDQRSGNAIDQGQNVYGL